MRGTVSRAVNWILISCILIAVLSPSVLAVENKAASDKSVAVAITDDNASTNIVSQKWLSTSTTPSDLVVHNPFLDVSSDVYYYNAVLWAVRKGITAGTSATTFSPDVPCTRGQVVTFLWRAAGSPTASGDTAFSDVKSDAYYAEAVAWAVKEGVTAGTSATTFSPDAPCTRGQVVTFLWRVAWAPMLSGDTAFSDVNSDAYYARAVTWAVGQKITAGTSSTTFSPDSPCTRGQIVTFIYRAL